MAVGIPVAVKTPVGIVVVLELLVRTDVPEVVFADVTGGALIITLDGGTDGLPATVLMLDPGLFQFCDWLYKTPLIMTPPRFAITFF